MQYAGRDTGFFMSVGDALPWVIFTAAVLVLLTLDLLVFHRSAHEVSRREALAWSAFWVALALVFNAGVYWRMGAEVGLQWTTGYLIEYSLSIDNLFVFLLTFQALKIPAVYQHRLLFWGVIGALVMRAVLIAVGGALIANFYPVLYIFGALLIVTAIKLWREEQHVTSTGDSRLIQFVRRFMPITDELAGQNFFVRRAGVRHMTPLFVALLLIEAADVVFAVDSVPAIFAVTSDPFIVFTATIAALLGLRSLYFVLSGYLGGLVYLRLALMFILMFVGMKLLLIDLFHVPALISLGVIVGILTVAVIASMLSTPKPSPAREVDFDHVQH